MPTKQKYILIGIFALSLCLVAVKARDRFLRPNRELGSPNIQAMIKSDKAQYARWEQQYGHIHPRSTVREVEVDPRSRRLRVRIKTYMPGCPGCYDETWKAVSLYLDGHFQGHSFTGDAGELREFESGEKAGEYGIFFFHLFSLKPIADGSYQVKVVDNKSGDKHEVDIKIRHGKVVVKPKAERQ